MDNKDEFEKLNPNTGADSSSEHEPIEELYNEDTEDIIEEPVEDHTNYYPEENNEELNKSEKRELHRKRVNDEIDEAGAKVIEKFGVPKPIAKFASKTNGGPLSPTNSLATKLTSRNLRNKVADATEDTSENTNNEGKENDNKSQSTPSKSLPTLPKTPLKKEDAKDEAKKQLKAELRKKILTSPYFWIAVGILALLLLIIVLLMMFLSDDSNNDTYLSSNAYGDVCDGFNFNSTSLSKEEFIARVTTYYTNQSHASERVKNIFIQNAGKVYDLSMQNNINPEIVITRAVAEGHSPSNTDQYADKNNYWGLGCNNTGTLNDCSTYVNFDDGVMGFIKNISQYDSLSSMMKRYSSIGSFWYNPGGTGLGGCYYFPYIRQYMSEERANQVEVYCQAGKYCDKSDHSPDCVETNDEDKDAYAKYQVAHMIEYRQTIFGIGDDCSNYSANCTIYAQGDNRWGNIHLGNSSAYMAKHGCAVTALAIGISCSGASVTIDNFDAGEFVKALNSGSCFSASGDIDWNCEAITKVAPSVTLAGRYTNIKNYSNNEKTEIINQYDPSKYFVIVQIANQNTNSHFLAFTKAQGDKYIVKDPGKGKNNSILIKDVIQILAYQYKEGE